MSNTVRIVFYEDGGEVEKVLIHSTILCPTCNVTHIPKDLTGGEMEEIGREAARVIGNCSAGFWSSGLIKELVRLYPDTIVGQVVEQHPKAVQAALDRHY